MGRRQSKGKRSGGEGVEREGEWKGE